MPPFVMMRPPSVPLNIIAPTTQDVAIIMGGGGDPFAEWSLAKAMCERAGKHASIFAGNDMIEFFPEDIDHAITLHPDKLMLWLPRRKAAGFNDPPKVWAHSAYEGSVTHWTRDWSGSTGLFGVKVARENGFVHVVLCGVHMNVDSNHFVRGQPWDASTNFRKGWVPRLDELRPYVRSFDGWTREELGAPTEDWLRTDIEDVHRNIRNVGLKA